MQSDDALMPYVIIGYNKDSPSREHIAIIDTNVPELRGLMREFTCRFREHVSVFVHSLRNALDRYKNGFAAYLLTRDVFEGEVDIKLPSHMLAFPLRAYPIVPFVPFDDYVPFNSYNDDGTKIDPNLVPKPGLCISCIHDDDPSEEMLCILNRNDQMNESEFKCDAYKSKSSF